MVPASEAEAREHIDKLLTACGWSVQDSSAVNIHAGRGVAIRPLSIDGVKKRALRNRLIVSDNLYKMVNSN